MEKARTTNVVLNAMTDLSGTDAQLKVALTGGATDTITASLTGGTNGVSLNALFGQFFPSSGMAVLSFSTLGLIVNFRYIQLEGSADLGIYS